MNKKFYLSLPVTALFASASLGVTSIAFLRANGENVIPYKTETVEIINPQLKDYFDAKTSQEQFRFLSSYSPSVNGYYDKPVIPHVTFRGNNNGPYLVNLSSDNFTSSRFIKTNGQEFVISSPIPGEQYVYEVSDSDNIVIARGEVNIKDDYGIRYMNIVSSYNVRDEGGWETASGKKVKYGLMYRGGRLNGGETIVKDDQIALYNKEMGIKSEIDLRNLRDDLGQRNAVFAENAFGGYTKNYIRDFDWSFGNYDGFFDKGTRKQVGKIFTYLSDIDNYPFYTHCSAGADRTGSLCLTLNGVLGVSYDDLVRDFELTSFSPVGNRWRAGANAEGNDFDLSKAYTYVDGMVINFPKMIQNFRKFGTPEDDFETCIYNFLTASIEDGGCGVDANDINTFRAIMLGLERKVDDARNVNETCLNGGVAVYEYEGEDILVNTKPLNHNFIIGENHVVCRNCHKSYVGEKIDVDVSETYDFGSDAVKAIMENDDVVTLDNGVATFDPNYAFDKVTPITVVTSSGSERVYLANMYSEIIDDSSDLFNIASTQIECVDSNGNNYFYGSYKLNNDIRLSDEDRWTKEYALGHSSVTSSLTGFRGVFDGNNHTISNFVTAGQDGALVYDLAGGEIRNLILEGKANDSYWGNDFLNAYTYAGNINNVKVKVELANGSALYHNTALLGTIGFNEALVNDIVVDNVTIEGINSTDVAYSNALGMLFKNYGLEYGFGNRLKLNNVTIDGLQNLMVCYSKLAFNYEVITDVELVNKWVDISNIDNLLIK